MTTVIESNVLVIDMIDENKFAEDIGSRIAACRKQAGLSQAQLAELVGHCQQTIADYETGRRRIPACKLAQLSEVLGVPATDFFADSDKLPRKRGPASRLQQQFERIKSLPRSEQQFVVRMLDNALTQGH